MYGYRSLHYLRCHQSRYRRYRSAALRYYFPSVFPDAVNRRQGYRAVSGAARLVPPPFGSCPGSSITAVSRSNVLHHLFRSMRVIWIGVLCSSSLISTFGVKKITRRAVMRLPATSPTVATLLARTPNHSSQTWDSYGSGFG